jgi:DNA transformation protein
MAVSPDFRDFVLEMLEAFGPVSFRPMFGGGGLYRTDLMFALITRSDVLYFRTDDQNTPDFIDAGMGPFVTNAEKKTTMPYHEVPADILEDTDEMCTWAQKAFDAALRAKQGANQRTKRGTKKKKTARKKHS